MHQNLYQESDLWARLRKLEMLAYLRAGQRDGRHRQADDFGGWVNMTALFWPLVDLTSIFGRRRGPFVVFNAVSRLSLSSFMPEILANSQLSLSCEVVENRSTVLDHNFVWERTQKLLQHLLPCLPPTVWQSLVEFCWLNFKCEARQWRKMQNFRRSGKMTVLFSPFVDQSSCLGTM